MNCSGRNSTTLPTHTGSSLALLYRPLTLLNELIKIFDNAFIATAVTLIVVTSLNSLNTYLYSNVDRKNATYKDLIMEQEKILNLSNL